MVEINRPESQVEIGRSGVDSQAITEEAITMKNIEDKFDQLQSMAQKSFKQLASPAPSDEAEARKRSPSTTFSKTSPIRKKASIKSSNSKTLKSKTPPRKQSRTTDYGVHSENKKKKLKRNLVNEIMAYYKRPLRPNFLPK